ncbi:MAG: ATP-binding protein [Streptosporangiaceae bacterium]
MCEHATVRPSAARPYTSRTCEHVLPGWPSQVRQARALLAAFLTGFPAADDAVLLASELCGNAVTHSASAQPGGFFILRARARGITHLLAEVEDNGSPWDGNIGTAPAPHGLFLVRQLSANCGTRPGHFGWITWFALSPACHHQATR